uniref:Serpin B6 n=1 Tax=Electrophorus electricus TaxID=8005 RepID=A0AAY5EEB5_ELEEL
PPPPPPHTHTQSLELNKTGSSYTLILANCLYAEKSYQFLEKFLHNTKTHYNAELEKVDFISYAEEAHIWINKWVEQHTNEKIKDLLAVGIVDSLTRLDLVNVTYFKGNWEKKFEGTATRELPFQLSKQNASKPVQLMHQKAKFPLAFIPDMKCQILEMPHVGKELSMLIILSNEIADNMTGWRSCDGKVVHKSFVEMNEEGTEAAAATAAVLVDCILPLASFVADHPFLFFIQHKPTHTIVFCDDTYQSP